MLHYGWHGPGYGFGFLSELLGPLLLIGLIALGIALLLRSRPGGTASQNKALEIARERYAKGEISYEEFQTIKKNLGA